MHEAKNGMAQAIREAKVSKNHYPLVVAKAQWSKDRVYKYRDYLKKLKEFYQRTLVAKNWEELYKERPHSNAEEKEFHEHFINELPFYFSMVNKHPLFVVNYNKGQIESVERFCMTDRNIPYVAEDIRIPIFIARTTNGDDYSGLRAHNGDYLNYIKQYMEEMEVRILEQEEFYSATDSFFNFDTRLTKERPTKSEDDLRKTNLESTLDGIKDLAKDFSRIDQKDKLSSSRELFAYEFKRSEERHRVIRTSKRYSETRRH